MKIFFDLFPVILFFITLKIAEKAASASLILGKILGFFGLGITVKPALVPIMLATFVVIVASILQIIYVKLKHGKVDKTLLLSAALVTILGSMTLYFQNDAFIKWKPTILYWAFFAVLIGAELFMHKNLMKTIMGKEMTLPDSVWKKLNYAWAIFFLCLGFINLYIAFNYSIDTWANFKLFGATGLMFIFAIIQTLFISKYLTVEDKP
jgi:intracellular septation protein